MGRSRSGHCRSVFLTRPRNRAAFSPVARRFAWYSVSVIRLIRDLGAAGARLSAAPPLGERARTDAGCEA